MPGLPARPPDRLLNDTRDSTQRHIRLASRACANTLALSSTLRSSQRQKVCSRFKYDDAPLTHYLRATSCNKPLGALQPFSLALSADITSKESFPTVHLKAVRQSAPPPYSDLSITTAHGLKLIFRGTPGQFWWCDTGRNIVQGMRQGVLHREEEVDS